MPPVRAIRAGVRQFTGAAAEYRSPRQRARAYSARSAPSARLSEARTRARSGKEWLPFVFEYRTLCMAPDEELRRVFEGVTRFGHRRDVDPPAKTRLSSRASVRSLPDSAVHRCWPEDRVHRVLGMRSLGDPSKSARTTCLAATRFTRPRLRPRTPVEHESSGLTQHLRRIDNGASSIQEEIPCA